MIETCKLLRAENVKVCIQYITYTACRIARCTASFCALPRWTPSIRWQCAGHNLRTRLRYISPFSSKVARLLRRGFSSDLLALSAAKNDVAASERREKQRKTAPSNRLTRRTLTTERCVERDDESRGLTRATGHSKHMTTSNCVMAVRVQQRQNQIAHRESTTR